MTKIRDDTFTHVLVGDVIAAQERLKLTDTQSLRRDLIRSTFAAIEGLHWQLKRNVLEHARSKLSHHERAAMMEETYAVDVKGNVEAVPRFLPLPTAIRLVVQIVCRYRPAYKVDFSHRGWSNLKKAVAIRNRLVHPKTLEDLTVSDADINAAISAFHWMLALAIEVMSETHEALKSYLTKSPSKA